MEPLPASARVPPRPPRPPAPPTTGELPRPLPDGRPSDHRRPSLWTFLIQGWQQLRLVAWPDGHYVKGAFLVVLGALVAMVAALALADLAVRAGIDVILD